MRLPLTLLLLITSGLAAFSQDTNSAKDPGSAPQANQWTGKRIIWCGTSIPWQYGDNSYPKQIGRMLGVDVVYNNSISGSSITFWPPSETDKGKTGLSGTFAEQLAAGYGQNNSYENQIMAHLGAPYNACAVVIDHGTNDTSFLPARLGDISSTDKGTFYGAYSFLIDAILTAKPKTIIILVTLPNRYFKSKGVYQTEKVDLANTAIRAIAEKYALPLFDLAKISRLNPKTALPGVMTTDDLHPTQETTNFIAVEGYRFMLGVN